MPVKTQAAAPAKTKAPAKAKAKNGGIKIAGEGKYPLVPTDSIQFVERPKPGEEEPLFFNPRALESFTPESMSAIRMSIRSDGLQQPPIVRAITSDGTNIVKVELIAGERRMRSLLHIIEHNLPCFDEDAKRPDNYKQGQIVICKGNFCKVLKHDGDDVAVQILDENNVLTDEQRTFSAEDVYPTVPGSTFYNSVPCKVAFDISDARALRLAFSENDKHKNLSTAEEMSLVERLIRRGMKIKEICEALGSNLTWVSQTANFRTALPPTALEKLLSGEMKRHTAVKIMGYADDDREALFEASVQAEKEETATRINEADEEATKAEDDELLSLSDQKKAAKAGDTKAANKAGREAASAATKAAKARDKKGRAEAESGQIRTGHIEKGAMKIGLSPKKAKILSKEEIEEFFISGLNQHLLG